MAPSSLFLDAPQEALKWVKNHFPSEEIIPLGGRSKRSKWTFPTQSPGAAAASAGGFEARTHGCRWVQQEFRGFSQLGVSGDCPSGVWTKGWRHPMWCSKTPFLPQGEAPGSGFLLTVGRCAAWVGFVVRRVLLLQVWCEPSLASRNNRSCLDRFVAVCSIVFVDGVQNPLMTSSWTGTSEKGSHWNCVHDEISLLSASEYYWLWKWDGGSVKFNRQKSGKYQVYQKVY